MDIEQRTIYYNIACRICEDFGIAVTADTLWRLVEIIADEFEKSTQGGNQSHENNIPS